MKKEYISIKLKKTDLYKLGDRIRGVIQSDNIKKGINYEKIIFEELKNDNSKITKLKFMVNTISFNQFKKVIEECLSDKDVKYYFPGLMLIKDDGNEILTDAFLVEDNKIKIVEIKKNLLQLDTGKSDNVYDRGVLIEKILNRELPNIKSEMLIVGMENNRTDKFNRMELHCNSINIMIGEDFLNKLGLDYNKIYNEVHTTNLQKVKEEIADILLEFNV
jgi:hypothetical protein